MRRELLYVSVILSILLCLSPLSAAEFVPEVIDFNCPCCGEAQHYTTKEDIMTSQLNCSECHKPIIAYRKHFVVSKKWTFEANKGDGVPNDKPYVETEKVYDDRTGFFDGCPCCCAKLLPTNNQHYGGINNYVKCCECGCVYQHWAYTIFSEFHRTIIIQGNITKTIS